MDEQPANRSTVIKAEQAPIFARGDGVETTLLISREQCPSAGITSGITSFPPDRKVPFHSHNCDEQVTVLEGQALCEIEGREPVAVQPLDTTFIAEGTSHRFVNTGGGRLRILWVYTTDQVTRTFSETGQTVEHLSKSDLVT